MSYNLLTTDCIAITQNSLIFHRRVINYDLVINYASLINEIQEILVVHS